MSNAYRSGFYESTVQRVKSKPLYSPIDPCACVDSVAARSRVDLLSRSAQKRPKQQFTNRKINNTLINISPIEKPNALPASSLYSTSAVEFAELMAIPPMSTSSASAQGGEKTQQWSHDQPQRNEQGFVEKVWANDGYEHSTTANNRVMPVDAGWSVYHSIKSNNHRRTHSFRLKTVSTESMTASSMPTYERMAFATETRQRTMRTTTRYDEQQRWHHTRYDTNDTIDRHHEKAWHHSHLPSDVRKTKIMAEQAGGKRYAERSEKVHYQASGNYLDNSVSMPSSRLSQFASSTSHSNASNFLANHRCHSCLLYTSDAADE